MEQQDLLQDLEEEIDLERATTGARFANLIIDAIGIRVVIYLGTVVIALLAMPSVVGSDDRVSIRDTFSDSPIIFFLSSYLSAILVDIVYYTIFEGATKGKSLGKFVTGTTVVKHDGTPITWKDALVRSLCRLVPFEPFSAFGGNPWHDKWTNTQVIKVRK